MRCLRNDPPRRSSGWRLLLSCLVAGGAAWPLAGASAARAGDVVRVEEDWELVVGQPDPATNAPQVTTVMSPVADVERAYAAFDINHHSQPDYTAGGLQLQVWSNGVPLLSNNDPDGALLSHSNESVRWTQQMELSNGVLTVAITNGTSHTWGDFGGGEKLRASVATTLANLNGYDPQVSVRNSGVGFSNNRVRSLVLKRVRTVTADGQVTEDGTEKTVFEHE